MSEQTIAVLLERLEKVTARLEAVEKSVASGAGASAVAAPAAAGPSSAAVTAYETLAASFDSVVDRAAKIDGVLRQQAALFKAALAQVGELIATAATSKKPADISSFLAPLQKTIGDIQQLRESNRASKVFNNLSVLSEGVPALAWVSVVKTPGPFVEEMRQAAEFYTNRILKDFKGKDENQVGFANEFVTFLKELRQYIKDFHTTELTWNPKGGDAKAPAAAAPAAAAPPAGGAPPPPPASLAKDIAAASGSGSGPAPVRGALFAEINKGNVTGGLKHVDKSQMTHKNPNLRAGSVVPSETPATKKASAPAGAKQVQRGPPKVELVGNKWVVENHVGNQSIVISETEPRQVIYIYKCENSVIQIKGKVNAITLDQCKKTGVVFDEAIATCEVVNCISLQVQCTFKVPAIAIDNTSGCQVILSRDGLATEIVSSKSCEMNVMFPGANPDDDMIEVPLPEQYKSHYSKGDRFVTEAVEHI